MIRLLVNILTVVSLLACLATALLWVRSYRALDQVYGRLWENTVNIQACNGRCDLLRRTLYRARPGVDPRLVERAARPFELLREDQWSIPERNSVSRSRYPLGDTDYWQRRPALLPLPKLSRRLAYARQGPGLYFWIERVVVPFWIPFLVFLLPPALFVGRRVRRFRASRSGLCVSCGYDLRSSKERCPECGTTFPACYSPREVRSKVNPARK